jgi:hypothetical protein
MVKRVDDGGIGVGEDGPASRAFKTVGADCRGGLDLSRTSD